MPWFWKKKKKSAQGSADPPVNKATQASGMSRDSLVRILDHDTGQVSTISAAELAPGMVQARMNGVEGTVWVDASRLNKNVYQHPPFGEDIRDFFRQIKTALEEVYPMTLEEWEDGFRRDHNPEPEIAYWLHLAQAYASLTAPDDALGATPERRHAVFRLLGACGVSPREQVLMVADYAPLTRPEAERVVNTFFGANA